MFRNRNDYYSNVPTPHLPRTKQKFDVHTRLQTFRHGHLIPFYCRLVYPHSTVKIDMTSFIRMDTSAKVPIDDIFLDHFYFFVPLRILDKNFEKILGYKNSYDSNTYNFPVMELDWNASHPATHDALVNYLGYGLHNPNDGTASTTGLTVQNNSGTISGFYVDSTYGKAQKINTYPLAAYYAIYNAYFRDENLDPEIPVDNLLTQGSTLSLVTLSANNLFKDFNVLPVNRFHDIFSNGLTTPLGAQDDVTIPLGTSAPIVASDSWVFKGSNSGIGYDIRTGSVPNPTATLQSTYQGSTPPTSGETLTINSQKVYADLKNAQGASIQQLYLSLALYQLFDKRGTYGSRLIEQIRGSFGLEVPDGLLNRPEYLGGSCQTLNNVPVLDMTGSNLGNMRGNSATLTGLNSFEKSFNEWGFIIGVSCTRIKHTINSGIINPAFKIFDNLDLYWPEFCNIGKMPTRNYRIFNSFLKVNNKNEEVFNYNEPWIDQHDDFDFAAGDFGAFSVVVSGQSELRKLWSYQDIYNQLPIFSASWLKEPESNIKRTLTAQLIPASTSTLADTYQIEGHQFMIQYKWRTELTMPIPVHSKVPNITGRI